VPFVIRAVPSLSDPDTSARVIRDVIVVDDSRAQRRIFSVFLRRWGYDVREAESGVSALGMCRAKPPDLVLSDWMMPGLTGPEFCREFRQLDRESYGYFILLTSKSEKNDIANGLDAGADDFLTKPINPAELRARITAGERILRMERELTEKNRLISSTLAELQTLYDGLDSDLIEARKLQQSLVRDRYHDLGAAEVSLLLKPSGHVGGDLVGMLPVNKKRVFLYGIDVSGHGVSSALMTARLASYLSASARDQNIAFRRTETGSYIPRQPAETITMLNRLILNEMETELYFTMLLADVSLDTGVVRIAQAGHPYPALQRACGRVEMAGSGGLPVGLVEGASYEDFEVTLSAGDRLLIHSDGVSECANLKGALLGDEGLARMMRDLRQTHGMAFLESMIWKLTEHAQDQDFGDDVSAVLLEFKSGGGIV